MRNAHSIGFLRVIAILLLTAAGTGVAAAQDAGKAASSGAKPFLTLAFQGGLPYGLVTTAVQAPGDSGGMNPIDSGWGAGLTFDLAILPEIKIFLDGNYFTLRKQVGVAGQDSSGEWVFEMTNYSTNQLHFSQDAYYDMTATGFRAGLKAVLPIGNLQPWVGAGYGFYRWDVSYDTADRSQSWGSGAGGYVWGLTYLAGIDWWMSLTKKEDLFVRLYADLAAPAVFPVITNLFNQGWTWDNSGGNNIMGAYRFLIAIGMPM